MKLRLLERTCPRERVVINYPARRRCGTDASLDTSLVTQERRPRERER
jgi:hypothetical protein